MMKYIESPRQMHELQYQETHLRDYLEILRRRKWIVISFFLCVVSLVTTVTFQTTPVYKATSELLIEREAPLAFTILDNTDGLHPSRDIQFYETQYRLLTSRSLASAVIQKLDLEREFAAQAKTDKFYLARLVEQGAKLIKNIANSPQRGHGDSRYPAESGKASDAEGGQVDGISSRSVDYYLKNISIDPVSRSKLIDITFSSPSRELAAKVANAHASTFIEQSLYKHQATAQHTLEWLQSELNKQKKKVEASQLALHNYRRVNGVFSVEDKQNIVTQKLADLSAALTKLKEDQISKRLSYDQTVDKRDLESLPESMKNVVLQNLRGQFTQLKAQQSQMASLYGPRHPKMIEINSNVSQLQREIEAELQRQKAALKSELGRADALEKAIQDELKAQKQVALALNEKSIEYDVLRRDAEMNQNIYDMLLKQAKEVTLTGDMKTSNISIVDKAEAPLFPAKPKVLINILAAVFVGLFFGIQLAFFIDYMDNTIKTPADVLVGLGMPVLGMIPYDPTFREKQRPLLPSSPPDPKLSRIADLGCRLLSCPQASTPKINGYVYIVESTVMAEGKTTVLGNLATNLARTGMRIAMVDCDFFRPSLHKLFELHEPEGLSDSMQSILSHDFRHGSLREYSPDDIFFLIRLRRLSGQLTIFRNGHKMKAAFANGLLLHLQDENNAEPNRLGSMLVHANLISENQLREALDHCRRTGFPLGYVLVSSGYLSHDKLRKPLRFQAEEHLQRLFSWKHGHFTFEKVQFDVRETERILFREDYSSTIRHIASLSGNRFLENEILSRTHPVYDSNLYIMPGGLGVTELNGHMSFEFLEKTFDILKHRFDLVLVDAPPLMTLAGMPPVSTLADGVIFVIKAGYLPMKLVSQAKTVLDEAGIKIVGAVLNQMREKTASNGYYSSY